MYAFTFHRPTTVRQAVNLLAKHEDAKLLAGGHSLIPVMKLRLASPPVIIDLSQGRGPVRRRVEGPFGRHRRDDAACRGREFRRR